MMVATTSAGLTESSSLSSASPLLSVEAAVMAVATEATVTMGVEEKAASSLLVGEVLPAAVSSPVRSVTSRRRTRLPSSL